ncbi:Bacteriophage CI repressor helix-turn-helix domain [Buttiauxella agrestis]|uniref:Bacteriophage CI repressor helix-turn-helix domain n=1 Tax=Buttiauxella agrestis TaxID=82977 RepID=A0A381C6P3_9ENTR|nr:phage repressor protein CI [Buttiauxella agrestis]SUW63531.1 Bacteriophage CI repressor helix-turn-helix domain [Buttiauxella agrestis]
MRIENAIAPEVLERILSAYGFKMQKELAEKLGIASSNVGSWIQRGHVPGNVIVQCALDTGADVNWIVTGELAKASLSPRVQVGQGKALYEEIMSNGGKPVLRRIMDAYGFTMQKQLCDLLEISSGTVSTWVRRDYFPGDVVVACALDTGVSLQWLATGKGTQYIESAAIPCGSLIPRKNLAAGVLHDAGQWNIDLGFISHSIDEPLFLYSSASTWIVDLGVVEISNGRWLLGIDNKYDVYDVTLLPGRKITVSNKTSNFTCGAEEVTTTGKVVLTMEYNF